MTRPDAPRGYPLGAALTLGQLDADPYRRWRACGREPVSWVPALEGWLVTRRDLCIAVMRDAERSPSTTRASRRPRSSGRACSPSTAPSTAPSRAVRRAFRRPEVRTAHRTDRRRGPPAGRRARAGRAGRDPARPRGAAGRRRVARALELVDTEPAESWAGTTRSSRRWMGCPSAARSARRPGRRSMSSLGGSPGPSNAAPACWPGPREARPSEVVSNAAVMMFGGIETSEGMTTTLSGTC